MDHHDQTSSMYTNIHVKETTAEMTTQSKRTASIYSHIYPTDNANNVFLSLFPNFYLTKKNIFFYKPAVNAKSNGSKIAYTFHFFAWFHCSLFKKCVEQYKTITWLIRTLTSSQPQYEPQYCYVRSGICDHKIRNLRTRRLKNEIGKREREKRKQKRKYDVRKREEQTLNDLTLKTK